MNERKKTCIDDWLAQQESIDINPYEETETEPEPKQEDRQPESQVKPKGRTRNTASTEAGKRACLYMSLPKEDMEKLKAMHFSRCFVDKDMRMTFGAYLRRLLEQGMKAEPREVRDMCKDLLKKQ